MPGKGTRIAEVLTRAKDDEGATTIEVSFASEDPYGRWFGDEVLGLKKTECDLTRLNNGAPFLADHYNSIGAILGVVEKAWLKGAGAERKGYAKIRMADTDEAKQYLALLDAGVASKISVGYTVSEYLVDKQDDKTHYRAVSWMPMEISAVAVAADDTVGVGKSEDDKGFAKVVHNTRSATMDDDDKGQDGQVSKADLDIHVKNAAGTERKRISEMIQYGEMHKDIGGVEMANEVVAKGGDLEDLKTNLLAKVRTDQEAKLEGLAAKGNLPTADDAHLDLSPNDAKDLSLSRWVRSQLEKNPNAASKECAVIEAYEKQMLDRGCRAKFGTMIPGHLVRDAARHELGRQALTRSPQEMQGLLMAMRILDTTGDAPDIIGTDHRGDMLVPFLYNNSAFLPYVQVLEGLVDSIQIPRSKTVITANWVAQDAAIGDVDPTFEKLELSPKQLAARSGYGRTLFNQSNPSIDGIIMMQLGEALALGEDQAVVNADGNNNNPTGILNQAGTTDADTGSTKFNEGDGRKATWEDVVNFETVLGDANVNLDERTMFWLPSALRGAFKTTKKDAGSGEFVWDSRNSMRPLNDYGARVSNQIPNDLTVGATTNTCAAIMGRPRDALCAHWSGFDMVVNPYSDDAKGWVYLTAYRDIDVGLLQPKAFAVVKTGIQR